MYIHITPSFTEKPHFRWNEWEIREPKLEMTSYSDNAYDVTNFFCSFEKFFAYTVFLPSFIVVRHQMAELTWGAFWLGLAWLFGWGLNGIIYGNEFLRQEVIITSRKPGSQQ